MGHRLSKITTRTGDSGDTGLGDGTRVRKDSTRVCMLGEIDELNSALGVALAEGLPADAEQALLEVQQELFELGGEISIPGHERITATHVARLEGLGERWNAELPPLKEFVLPGGTPAAALVHVARAVCRRAERSLVALAHAERVAPQALRYLNRLSDLLFILGRRLNRDAGRADVLWRRDARS